MFLNFIKEIEVNINKVWFITGSSGGIGLAIVKTALNNCDLVVATTRDGVLKTIKKNKNLLVLPLDVSQQNQNVFGTMRVTRSVLPIMRKQGQGHIFNISSGAGYCGGLTAYHTSKFAVTSFSCSLAFELASFGIKVTNVVPGMFRTSFYDSDKIKTDYDIHIEDYDTCRWQNNFMQENSKHNQVEDPNKLAELLYEVAYSDNPPLHLSVGADAVAVLEDFGNKIKQDTTNWKDKTSKTNY